MKHGPYIFLGALFAFALSWLGMVAVPQFQIGAEQPTNVPPANIIYPIPHSGVANAGHEVYRAQGCQSCHTQVIRQEGAHVAVKLVNAGTNEPAVVEALARVRSDLSPAQAQKLVASAPSTVWVGQIAAGAETTQKALSDAGGQVSVQVEALGSDIQRGWGTRLTVAHDYLYDTPVLLGSVRLGPDLTNVGLRKPDPVWHLVHLYDPRIQVPGSTMPRYPYLFEKRKRGGKPSPDALPVPGDQEIIPTREARALVEYLLSLRADVPLFEAPAPPLPGALAAGGTNQPASTETGTNTVPSAAPTNSAGTSQPAPQ